MAAQPLLLSCFCPYLFFFFFLEETLCLCPCLAPAVILSQRPRYSYQCVATVPALPSRWWKITPLIYSVILGSHNGPLKQIIWATNLRKKRHFNWLLAFDHMPVPRSFISASNRMNIHAHLLRFLNHTAPTIKRVFVCLNPYRYVLTRHKYDAVCFCGGTNCNMRAAP